jgi:hypothetical protein
MDSRALGDDMSELRHLTNEELIMLALANILRAQIAALRIEGNICDVPAELERRVGVMIAVKEEPSR